MHVCNVWAVQNCSVSSCFSREWTGVQSQCSAQCTMYNAVPDVVPTSADWSAWDGLMATIRFGLVSGLYWAPGGSNRARFGPKFPLLDQIGLLAATKRPNINPKCVVTISLTQADQLVAVGTKSGPLGPSDDLQGLQKGHFGQNGPFWGPSWPKAVL